MQQKLKDAMCNKVCPYNSFRVDVPQMTRDSKVNDYRIPLSPPDSKALAPPQITANNDGFGMAKRTTLEWA